MKRIEKIFICQIFDDNGDDWFNDVQEVQEVEEISEEDSVWEEETPFLDSSTSQNQFEEQPNPNFAAQQMAAQQAAMAQQIAAQRAAMIAAQQQAAMAQQQAAQRAAMASKKATKKPMSKKNKIIIGVTAAALGATAIGIGSAVPAIEKNRQSIEIKSKGKKGFDEILKKNNKYIEKNKNYEFLSNLINALKDNDLKYQQIYNENTPSGSVGNQYLRDIKKIELEYEDKSRKLRNNIQEAIENYEKFQKIKSEWQTALKNLKDNTGKKGNIPKNILFQFFTEVNKGLESNDPNFDENDLYTNFAGKNSPLNLLEAEFKKSINIETVKSLLFDLVAGFEKIKREVGENFILLSNLYYEMSEIDNQIRLEIENPTTSPERKNKLKNTFRPSLQKYIDLESPKRKYISWNQWKDTSSSLANKDYNKNYYLNFLNVGDEERKRINEKAEVYFSAIKRLKSNYESYSDSRLSFLKNKMIQTYNEHLEHYRNKDTYFSSETQVDDEIAKINQKISEYNNTYSEFNKIIGDFSKFYTFLGNSLFNVIGYNYDDFFFHAKQIIDNYLPNFKSFADDFKIYVSKEINAYVEFAKTIPYQTHPEAKKKNVFYSIWKVYEELKLVNSDANNSSSLKFTHGYEIEQLKNYRLEIYNKFASTINQLINAEQNRKRALNESKIYRSIINTNKGTYNSDPAISGFKIEQFIVDELHILEQKENLANTKDWEIISKNNYAIFIECKEFFVTNIAKHNQKFEKFKDIVNNIKTLYSEISTKKNNMQNASISEKPFKDEAIRKYDEFLNKIDNIRKEPQGLSLSTLEEKLKELKNFIVRELNDFDTLDDEINALIIEIDNAKAELVNYSIYGNLQSKVSEQIAKAEKIKNKINPTATISEIQEAKSQLTNLMIKVRNWKGKIDSLVKELEDFTLQNADFMYKQGYASSYNSGHGTLKAEFNYLNKINIIYDKLLGEKQNKIESIRNASLEILEGQSISEAEKIEKDYLKDIKQAQKDIVHRVTIYNKLVNLIQDINTNLMIPGIYQKQFLSYGNIIRNLLQTLQNSKSNNNETTENWINLINDSQITFDDEKAKYQAHVNADNILSKLVEKFKNLNENTKNPAHEFNNELYDVVRKENAEKMKNEWIYDSASSINKKNFETKAKTEQLSQIVQNHIDHFNDPFNAHKQAYEDFLANIEIFKNIYQESENKDVQDKYRSDSNLNILSIYNDFVKKQTIIISNNPNFSKNNSTSTLQFHEKKQNIVSLINDWRNKYKDRRTLFLTIYNEHQTNYAANSISDHVSNSNSSEVEYFKPIKVNKILKLSNIIGELRTKISSNIDDFNKDNFLNDIITKLNSQNWANAIKQARNFATNINSNYSNVLTLLNTVSEHENAMNNPIYVLTKINTIQYGNIFEQFKTTRHNFKTYNSLIKLIEHLAKEENFDKFSKQSEYASLLANESNRNNIFRELKTVWFNFANFKVSILDVQNLKNKILFQKETNNKFNLNNKFIDAIKKFEELRLEDKVLKLQLEDIKNDNLAYNQNIFNKLNSISLLFENQKLIQKSDSIHQKFTERYNFYTLNNSITNEVFDLLSENLYKNFDVSIDKVDKYSNFVAYRNLFNETVKFNKNITSEIDLDSYIADLNTKIVNQHNDKINEITISFNKFILDEVKRMKNVVISNIETFAHNEYFDVIDDNVNHSNYNGYYSEFYGLLNTLKSNFNKYFNDPTTGLESIELTSNLVNKLKNFDGFEMSLNNKNKFTKEVQNLKNEFIKYKNIRKDITNLLNKFHKNYILKIRSWISNTTQINSWLKNSLLAIDNSGYENKYNELGEQLKTEIKNFASAENLKQLTENQIAAIKNNIHSVYSKIVAGVKNYKNNDNSSWDNYSFKLSKYESLINKYKELEYIENNSHKFESFKREVLLSYSKKHFPSFDITKYSADPISYYKTKIDELKEFSNKVGEMAEHYSSNDNVFTNFQAFSNMLNNLSDKIDFIKNNENSLFADDGSLDLAYKLIDNVKNKLVTANNKINLSIPEAMKGYLLPVVVGELSKVSSPLFDNVKNNIVYWNDAINISLYNEVLDAMKYVNSTIEHNDNEGKILTNGNINISIKKHDGMKQDYIFNIKSQHTGFMTLNSNPDIKNGVREFVIKDFGSQDNEAHTLFKQKIYNHKYTQGINGDFKFNVTNDFDVKNLYQYWYSPFKMLAPNNANINLQNIYSPQNGIITWNNYSGSGVNDNLFYNWNKSTDYKKVRVSGFSNRAKELHNSVLKNHLRYSSLYYMLIYLLQKAQLTPQLSQEIKQDINLFANAWVILTLYSKAISTSDNQAFVNDYYLLDALYSTNTLLGSKDPDFISKIETMFNGKYNAYFESSNEEEIGTLSIVNNDNNPFDKMVDYYQFDNVDDFLNRLEFNKNIKVIAVDTDVLNRLGIVKNKVFLRNLNVLNKLKNKGITHSMNINSQRYKIMHSVYGVNELDLRGNSSYQLFQDINVKKAKINGSNSKIIIENSYIEELEIEDITFNHLILKNSYIGNISWTSGSKLINKNTIIELDNVYDANQFLNISAFIKQINSSKNVNREVRVIFKNIPLQINSLNLLTNENEREFDTGHNPLGFNLNKIGSNQYQISTKSYVSFSDHNFSENPPYSRGRGFDNPKDLTYKNRIHSYSFDNVYLINTYIFAYMNIQYKKQTFGNYNEGKAYFNKFMDDNNNTDIFIKYDQDRFKFGEKTSNLYVDLDKITIDWFASRINLDIKNSYLPSSNSDYRNIFTKLLKNQPYIKFYAPDKSSNNEFWSMWKEKKEARKAFKDKFNNDWRDNFNILMSIENQFEIETLEVNQNNIFKKGFTIAISNYRIHNFLTDDFYGGLTINNPIELVEKNN